MKPSRFVALALPLAVLVIAGWFFTRDEPTNERGESNAPRTEAPQSLARPSGQSRQVEDMQARLDDQAQRLVLIERRLEESERQIVNFQIFVQKLIVGGERVEVAEDPTARSAKPANEPFGVSHPLPDLRPGTPLSTVVADLGEPDERDEHELRYFQQGLRVVLDEHGAVEEVTVFGETRGLMMDANGNSGLEAMFREDGKWYRAARQSVGGIEMGTPGPEVIRRLGHATEIVPDADGRFHLYYESRGLMLVLGASAPYPVVGARLGGGPPRPDSNGNVE